MVKAEELLHTEVGGWGSGGGGEEWGKKSTDRTSVSLLKTHRQYLQDKNCVLIKQLSLRPSIKPTVY